MVAVVKQKNRDLIRAENHIRRNIRVRVFHVTYQRKDEHSFYFANVWKLWTVFFY